MAVPSDDDLYQQGAATLVASWSEYARAATGASVRRLSGVAVAVFPHGAERSVYNNALLARHLNRSERALALDAMAATYATSAVSQYAAWVHETDRAMRSDLIRRGYTLDSSTTAMGMALTEISTRRADIDMAPPDWTEHLRVCGLPPDLLRGGGGLAFHVRIARADGENVATAIALDHDTDCGIFNVTTREHARRRGLGTALTLHHLHDAVERGRLTASLQSSRIAERVYATVGFRDLGRHLEYVAPARAPSPPAESHRVARRRDL